MRPKSLLRVNVGLTGMAHFNSFRVINNPVMFSVTVQTRD